MISDFEWRHGVTLLSSRSSVALCVAAYLLMVAVMPRMLRGPLVVPRQLMWLHNSILCFGSAIMFVGATTESYNEVYAKGSVRWMYCLPPATPIKVSIVDSL